MILCLGLFLFSGCHSLKKVQTVSTVRDSLSVKTIRSYSTAIDTSETINTTVQIVTVDYGPGFDSARFTVGPDTYTGRIKSANVTTITRILDKKGITKTDSTINTIKVQKIITTTATKTDAAKDPYRWRWIFGIAIAVLGILVFAFYQLKPLLTTFKPLTWFTNLFKK